MRDSSATAMTHVFQTIDLARPEYGGIISGLAGEIIDLRGVPRARVVIGSDGRKRLEYEAGSLWALPPIDLGRVRSDRLDDYLYGEA